MNPDQQPSRDEIEAKLTALLLGELPDEEARLLRWAISQDPELAVLHDRLQKTIGFVKEVSHPGEAPAAVEHKLSLDRRQQLLAHFKTPRTIATGARAERVKEPAREKETERGESWWLAFFRMPSLVNALAVIAICAILAGLLLPALSKAKSKGMHVAALNMEKQEELAKAMEPAAVPPPSPVSEAGPAASAAAPAQESAKIELPPPASPAPAVAQGGVISQNVAGYLNTALLATNGYVAVNNPLSAGTSSQPVASADESAAPNANYRLLADNKMQTDQAPQGRFKNFQANDSTQNARGDNQDQASNNNFYQHAAQQVANGQNAILNEAQNAPAAAGEANSMPGPMMGGGGGNLPASPPEPDSSPAFRAVPDGVPMSEVEAAGAIPDVASVTSSSMTDGEKESSRRAGATTARGHETGKAAPGSSTSLLSFLRHKKPVGVTPLPGSRAGGVAVPDEAAEIAPGSAMASSGPILADQPNAVLAGVPALLPPPPVSAPTIETQAKTDRNYVDNNADLAVARPPVSLEIPAPAAPMPSAKPAIPYTPTISGSSVALAGLNKDKSDEMRRDDLSEGFERDRAVAASGKTRVVVTNAFIGQYAYVAPSDAVEVSILHTNPTTPQEELAQWKDLGLKPEQLVAGNGIELAYQEANRKLDDLKKSETLLSQRMNVETTGLRLPRSSVTIVDTAEPQTKQSFWQKLNGKAESIARVKVEKDQSDVALLEQRNPYIYDPYFIQTEYEVIQSSAVLGKVIEDLKLDEAWAKQNGGRKMSPSEAYTELRKRISLQPVKNTSMVGITAEGDNPEQAANLANAVAIAYQNYRLDERKRQVLNGINTLQAESQKQQEKIRQAQAEVDRLARQMTNQNNDLPIRKPATNAPMPQPEIQTTNNAVSTFSLNVSDVSFNLAAASLENGRLPEPASIRTEEFINAFDYHDPEAAAGQPIAFTSERARYPFAQNRDLLRFSLKTAAAGRQAGRALNLVLLLDNSGSMERADRVDIIRAALKVLAGELQPQDTVSVVTFARTARLWADGVTGDKAAETFAQIAGVTPEGGTNLEEAMRLAYETARRHYLASGMNRVVLLTDGAANLGNVNGSALAQKVEENRKQGIALDCFGIGWEDYNDDLLEQLSSRGDGRYAFLNSPAEASQEFAAKLAGALQVAASDVKVQVEFNPQRVTSYRQIGYAKHQLTKEQFRDNSVDAGEIAAQEAGNALYTIEAKPDGTGPVASVRVRYKVPGTQDYRERSWDVPYTGKVPSLAQASPAMRLAGTAAAFSEWLVASPFAQEVTPQELLKDLNGVPETYGADPRPKKLQTMIRQAERLVR